MQDKQNKKPEYKKPAPIKWRNDPKDYIYPRTSKDAFGYELRDEDFEQDMVRNMGDLYVAVGCVLMALALVIFL